ncbi:MAG: hypothetical protein GY784_16070, partial [Gammaproteobacteria bacterium]|nr:hypothetical protein [Gammaproteobacteria bacterium]
MDIKIAPIVLSFGIVITLFQVFNYDMVSEVDWVSAFSEGTIALTVLAGVFLVSKLRSETKVFGFLMGGFILLFIALLTDTLDEIYTSPDWVSTIFEDIFQLVGFILVVVGLFFWLRLNSQMQFDLVQLATIDPLTGCLNRRSFGE